MEIEKTIKHMLARFSRRAHERDADASLSEGATFVATESQFDASEYLFLSKSVAQHYPELVESRIIVEYKTSLPGHMAKLWLSPTQYVAAENNAGPTPDGTEQHEEVAPASIRRVVRGFSSAFRRVTHLFGAVPMILHVLTGRCVWVLLYRRDG
jgi:hypothetical protein